jgi:hypothetical protein
VHSLDLVKQEDAQQSCHKTRDSFVAAGLTQMAEAQPTIGSRLSAFVEVIKPYREIIAILIAIIVGLSTVLSWIVSKVYNEFATKIELKTLNCRINNDLGFQVYNASTPYAAQIDWRQSQIRQLALQPQPTDYSRAIVTQLGNEVDDLIKRQADMAKQYSQKLQEINFTCTQTPQK